MKAVENAAGKAIKTDFGSELEPLPIAEGYYPTRLEYFAGKALQGLVVGRSDKDVGNTTKIARVATQLAEAVENAVDTAQG